MLLWVLGPDVSQHSISTSSKRARLAQQSKYGGGRWGSSGGWRWWSQHEWQPSIWGAGWIFEQTNPVCENSLLYRPPKTLGSRCESEYVLFKNKIYTLCWLAKSRSSHKIPILNIHFLVDMCQTTGLNKSISFQGASWHKHKHWLAFIGGHDQVFVHDFEDTGLSWSLTFFKIYPCSIGTVHVDVFYVWSNVLCKSAYQWMTTRILHTWSDIEDGRACHLFGICVKQFCIFIHGGVQEDLILVSKTYWWCIFLHLTESRDPAVLVSDSQKGIECVEWRPNAGSTLSVACRWFCMPPGNCCTLNSL